MPFDEQLALYIFAIWEVDYYRYFCDRYKEISMHVPEFFQFSAMILMMKNTKLRDNS